MDFLNKDSKTVYSNAKCHKDLLPNLKELDRFQFERKGYFVVDKDSDFEKKTIVWNKIVETQDNKNKKWFIEIYLSDKLFFHALFQNKVYFGKDSIVVSRWY